MTPEQARRAIAKLPGQFDRVVANAFRRGTRRIREDAIKRLTSGGVGRKLWGKKPKGARAQVKQGKIVTRGAGVSTEFVVQGMAALQDQGGRTKPHPIPKSARALEAARARGKVFHLKSLGNVFVSVKNKPIQHPGSNVARRPFMDPAISAGSPAIDKDIEALTDAMVGRVLGG